MEQNRVMAAIETILFAMGDSVEIETIAKALEISEEDVRDAVHALEERCNEPQSGLMINWLEDSVQISSRPEYYEYLVKIAKAPKKQVLTDTLMETLSIIAYKQPVTRIEIEKVRGVSCDHAINKLLEYDLIQELGRLDAPGKPLLFGTTEQFLRSFGVHSLDELPEINPVQIEEFKKQAEEEIQLKLDI
jgi:segregation and condensation protein B